MFRRVCIFFLILLVVSVSVRIVEGSETTTGIILNEIRLEGGTTLLEVGSKCSFRVIGQYSDGTERDITDEAEWISVNDRVGRFADKGVLVGGAVGSTLVFASLSRIRSSSLRVHIEPATRPVLKVLPLKVALGNIEKDRSKEFTVTVKNIGRGDLKWEIRSSTSWLVVNSDLSREAYDLWRKTSMKNMPKPVDMNGDGKIDYFPPKVGQLSYTAWMAERRELQDGLTRRNAADTITITAYTLGLTDGEYKGKIFVISDAERQEIEISMKVVSLQYITITPVSIKVRAGQSRKFRAAGVWSDGSKTDLSESLDGRWVISDPSVGKFLYGKPVFVARKTGKTEIKKIRGDIVSDIALVEVEEGISRPVLAVSPREIDLGAIGPGESSKGTFSLKNFGSGFLGWYIEGLSEWSLSGEEGLSGIVRNTSGHIRAYLSSLKKEGKEDWEEPEEDASSLYPVQLRLESEGNFVTYVKNLPIGTYREMITLSSDGGVRRIFLRFEVTQVKSVPSIKVGPLGIDSGVVASGKHLVKRVELTNEGRDVLKWKARLQGNRRTFAGVPLKKGRYVSLLNPNVRDSEKYAVPGHLKDSVDISGVWSEDRGYPYSYGEEDILKYKFSGTGIALFIWKDFEGGYLTTYVDDELMKEIDCYSEKNERTEFLVVEGLEDGPHVLKLVSEEGRVVIEGVRVYSSNIIKGNYDWIEIFPDIGTTTSETDYVNVMINSRGLKPGYYSENILFSSNGGTEVVEVTLQVSEHKASEIIDIYRYVRESDCLFTADPQIEGLDVLKGYKKQGIAFRLFSKDAPGTTEFFRWHNSSKKSHFYSVDREGKGKSLTGYVLEESIGNIATTKLSRTKELYRWFNLSSGVYFYTTDPKGEGCSRRGYKYDGIAGYVR
ncbi:MAG: hypothetical protein Q7J27_03620 [Syntrophales bacterium]|nr:hypothetical protein [Syntrophales bacterium]